MEAFLQHPQWQAVPSATSQNQSCNHVDEQYAPSADAVASQLVWAEYECIDWERIYAGGIALLSNRRQLSGCLTQHPGRERNLIVYVFGLAASFVGL